MWDEWKHSKTAGEAGSQVSYCPLPLQNCLLPDHSSFIPHPQTSPDSAYILLKAGRDTRGTPASNDISVDVKDVICCG